MPKLTFDNLVILRCEKSGYVECYIASLIWMVVPFTLIFIGVIGNVLSMITFASQKLRKKSTCVYLILLAVSDTILLCSAPLDHAIKAVFSIDMKASSSFSCRITGWIIQTSGMISNWTIVLITAERAFVTLFPVTAKPRMTPRNAVFISVSMLALIILLNTHLIFGRGIVERNVTFAENNRTSIKIIKSCMFRANEYVEFYNGVWIKLRMNVGSILPLVLTVTGNTTVAISLIKSERALRRVQDNSGRVQGNRIPPARRNNSNYKMFFVLCGVFLVTTVPFGVYLNLFESGKTVDEKTLAKYQLSSVIMRCFYWSNFSLNFLLYCMTGSLFRKELKRILKSAHKTFSSVTTRSSVQPLDDHHI